VTATAPGAGLDRLVPDLALRWYHDTPERRWQQLDGTLCFADIAGFTALAERLAGKGRAGGEELVETLSAVFARMLELAARRGGSLLKFGGDALLLFFDGPDHPRQAASAAVEMRTALREASRQRSAVGPLRLSMSVGLHAGPVDAFLVGDGYRELVLLGPAVNAVIATEQASGAGQILLSPATSPLLPAGATRLDDGGCHRLRWRRAPVPAPGAAALPPSLLAGADALLPPRLADHLRPGPPEPEHRLACVAFARFSGTDRLLAREGGATLAARLDDTLGPIQQVLAEEDVTLFTVDVDRDGGKLFMGAGVPFAHEDGEGLMLRAMRRLLELRLPLPLQIGVQRGHVFAAEVGSPRRAAFSAMGDSTNTAARIAAATPPGTLFAHPAVLDESRSRFVVAPAGPLSLKGKAGPQPVYRVGAFAALRQREGLAVHRLLGRQAELAALSRLLDPQAPAAQRLLCLSGAAGSGKSRLLRELEAPPGATLLRLYGEPYGTTSPYGSWRDPLRALFGLDAETPAGLARQLEGLVRDRAPELLPWLALIGSVVQVAVPESPEVARLEPQFRPQRTAAAVLDLCEAVSDGHPVVLMDDAHWADEASTRLLDAVAQRCAGAAWALLVSRREDAAGYRPADAARIDLLPLSDAVIRELLELATEAAPLRPQALQAIVRRAAGNPRFAEEFLRSYREAGSLAALPESLEAALLTQVEGLDGEARRLLRYAAVLGRSFTAEVLLEVATAVTGEAFDGVVLDRLDGYLEREGDGLYRFAIGALRDTLYENLAYRLRRRLHQAAARALEARHGDPTALAATLALHFFRAEDYRPAARYARLAADRARDNYANADAASLYQIALDAQRRAGRSAQAETELLVALGEVRQRAGEYDEAQRAYRLALRRAGNRPEQRAELIYRRAAVKEQAGAFPAALRDSTLALKALAAVAGPAATALRARIEALRAMVLLAQDRPGRALQQARVAAARARSAGEPRALVYALNAMAIATLELEGPGDGRHLQEAMAVAAAADDTGLRAMAATNLGASYVFAGRWTEAVRWLREGRDLNLATGNYAQAAYASINMAELLINQRRGNDARPLLEDALRVMRGLGSEEGVATALIQRARLRLLDGDCAEALAQAAEAAERLQRLGERHYQLEAHLVAAEAELRLGEAPAALLRLRAAEERAGDEAAHLRPRLALLRARLLAAVGDEGVEALLAEAVRGAQQQGLRYEWALLTLLQEELTPQAAPETAILAQARQTLAQLGIEARV